MKAIILRNKIDIFKNKVKRVVENPKLLFRYKDKLRNQYESILNFSSKQNSFVICVIIPTIIVFLYSALIESPRYESNASVIIKRNQAMPSVSEITALFGQSSSVSNDYLIMKYISSLDMLLNLNNEMNVLNLFKAKKIDFLSRLSLNANKKEELEYYQKMVSSKYDTNSAAIDVTAQAYKPYDAKKILENILANLQNYVDYIDHKVIEERLSFSQKQVDIAKDKVKNAEVEVLNFQNKYNLLDPKGTVEGISKIIAGLQSKLAQEETVLSDMLSYMQNNSSAIISQRQKIKALKGQIIKQESVLFGKHNIDTKKLNYIMAQFEKLKLNAQMVLEEYKIALQSHEVNKMDAVKRKEQLVVVQNPTLPDYATYPRVWYITLSVFIILLMLYGVTRMIITIIREHRL